MRHSDSQEFSAVSHNIVRQLQYEPDHEVVPQAIFWRPLVYFTMLTRSGEDGLDLYVAASFIIGNDIKFDLRFYQGHPDGTVTLYLPEEVTDSEAISNAIDAVIEAMLLPYDAVAWRRGQTFEYGKLKQPEGGRLREREARILVLKIAAGQPSRVASTTLLKREVPKYVRLSAHDMVPSPSRPREVLWQQVVGNVISHKSSREGLFFKGLAERIKGGLRVTEKGLAYLNNIGFNTAS